MIKYCIYILIIILAFSGCKSTKNLVRDTPVPDRDNSELYNAIVNHNYNYQWFSGISNIKVTSPVESFKAKVYIRIRKDSAIWTVFKKLGIEVGRGLIRPEAYATINRVNGTYTEGKTVEIINSLSGSLDYKHFQEFLFGNIILPDTVSIVSEKSNDTYHLRQLIDDVEIKYTIDAYSLEVTSFLYSDKVLGQVLIEYKDYRPVLDIGPVSFKRKIIITDPLHRESRINITFKKISIDEPKSLIFTIPSHYEKTEFIY